MKNVRVYGGSKKNRATRLPPAYSLSAGGIQSIVSQPHISHLNTHDSLLLYSPLKNFIHIYSQPQLAGSARYMIPCAGIF